MQSATSIAIPATLSLALIGSGKRVADWLPALTGSQAAAAGLVLTALCDFGPVSAEGPRHDPAVPDLPRVSDMAAVLAISPDLIIDANSTLMRSAITCAALRSGAHVLCHPLLALNADTALALMGAAARAPGLFAMGYQWRYRAGLRQLRDVVSSGVLGHPVASHVVLSVEDAFSPQNLLRGPAGAACAACDAARAILRCDAMVVRCTSVASGLCCDMANGVTFHLSTGAGVGSWHLNLEGGAVVCHEAGPARVEKGGRVLPDSACHPEGPLGALINLVTEIRGKGRPAVGPRSAAASHAMGLAARRSLCHGGREETVMPLGLMGDASRSPVARRPRDAFGPERNAE